MKKMLVSLLFVSSIFFVHGQDEKPKNELSINVMPLFRYGADNTQSFGLYRRYFGTNALRIAFAGNTYSTNPDKLDLQNTSFVSQDSAFTISKTGNYGGVARLQAGYEKHFMGKYPNFDLYVGADAFVGMGNKSFTKYQWKFQQGSDSSYSYMPVNQDNPVSNKLAIFQVGVAPVLGLNVGLGKRFFVGGEAGFNFYEEWQKNTKNYPAYRFDTFNMDMTARIMLGIRF